MSDPKPTAEALLQLLDSEIEHARAEEQRGGWNNWALSGALVGILGFAGSLWQDNVPSYGITITWILALASILDPMATRIWAWARHVRTRMSGMRYQFFSDLEDRRLAYVWWAARALLLAAGAISIWDDGVWKPALVWTVVNYVGIASAMIVMVLMSYLDLPFSTSIATGRSMKWVSVVFWLVISTATASFFLQISLPRAGAPNLEVILAIFLLAASYLFFRLLCDIRRPVRIDRLVEIRRGLVLGHIALTEAIEATEIALVGMEGRTALAEHLRRTLALHRTFAEHAVRVNFLVRDALAILEQANSPLTTKDGREELRDESSERLRQAEKALKQTEQLYLKINRRMGWYASASTQLSQEAPHSLFGEDGSKQLSIVQDRVTQANADAGRELDILRTNVSTAIEAISAVKEG